MAQGLAGGDWSGSLRTERTAPAARVGAGGRGRPANLSVLDGAVLLLALLLQLQNPLLQATHDLPTKHATSRWPLHVRAQAGPGDPCPHGRPSQDLTALRLLDGFSARPQHSEEGAAVPPTPCGEASEWAQAGGGPQADAHQARSRPLGHGPR